MDELIENGFELLRRMGGGRKVVFFCLGMIVGILAACIISGFRTRTSLRLLQTENRKLRAKMRSLERESLERSDFIFRALMGGGMFFE